MRSNERRVAVQTDTCAWLKAAANRAGGSYDTAKYSLLGHDVDGPDKAYVALDADKVLLHRGPCAKPVLVISEDTLVCATMLLDANPGKTVGVLNMASAYSVGGGYRHGAGAQEEDLFRRTDVSVALERQRPAYPIGPTRMLVQPRVRVLRGPGPEYAWLPAPHRTVTMLTAAALRHPDTTAEERFTAAGSAIMRVKIRLMLAAAARHGCHMLVLGAWGCGAYRCPPRHVAELFHEALQEHGACFGKVVFAILRRPYDAQDNFAVFQTVFGGARGSGAGVAKE
jgi:uncharacterized protein (TIGR02452 family)